jgi:glutamate formiminotransferase/formiminotetrahydrofolate cyclodeaminase
VIRSGEYEGFSRKMSEPGWAPDFGPTTFNARTGATVIGARDFLVAYNVNLNTTSTRRANAVAFDVREVGRPKREGDPLTGKPALDQAGNPVMIPGTLQAVKAIGWYIEEYRIAQVSMNLTNLSVTPVHVAFDEVCDKAEQRGLRVTGSELVGLIPLRALLDAGRYFLRKQQRSLGVSESELIHIAVTSLGLDQLGPFKPAERIIEHRLRDTGLARLVDRTVVSFVDETAAESAAPGGGSVAALLGALGAALGTMVANLSAHKRGWDARWEEFSDWAVAGQARKDELVRLVDEDTAAFNRVLAAMALPKDTAEQKATRAAALEAANRGAIEVPLRVVRTAHGTFPLLKAMAEHGLPASASDAGVGALCARSAVLGAWLNVRTNLPGLVDRGELKGQLEEAARMAGEAASLEAEIQRIVDAKIDR